MKKKLIIELIVYIVIVVIGIVMMITYEPEDVTIVLPKDFQIEQKGGANDAFIPIQ